MNRRSIPVLGLLLVAGMLWGCGGDSEPPAPTAASLTAEGWQAFAGNDFATADARFLDALALDPEHAEAHTGRGWIAVRGADYAAAGDRFAIALSWDAEALDALSGQVLVEAAGDRPDGVYARGLDLLDQAPGYVFDHDPSYAASDVRWLTARAAMDLGNYAGAVVQLDVLAPGHGLDPAEAGFVEQALGLLETLRNTV